MQPCSKKAPQLQTIIGVSGAFPDTVDYVACEKHGVEVLSCAPGFKESVAEMLNRQAISLMQKGSLLIVIVNDLQNKLNDDPGRVLQVVQLKHVAELASVGDAHKVAVIAGDRDASAPAE